jgi:hypothetical protein
MTLVSVWFVLGLFLGAYAHANFPELGSVFGWRDTVEPASGYGMTSNLQGLPLVIGAVLLVVAGLWFGPWARRAQGSWCRHPHDLADDQRRRAQLHRLRAVPGLGAEVGGRRRDRADGRAGRGGLLVLAAGILALVVAVVAVVLIGVPGPRSGVRADHPVRRRVVGVPG